jgi:hypothetical protein
MQKRKNPPTLLSFQGQSEGGRTKNRLLDFCVLKKIVAQYSQCAQHFQEFIFRAIGNQSRLPVFVFMT